MRGLHVWGCEVAADEQVILTRCLQDEFSLVEGVSDPKAFTCASHSAQTVG